MMKLLGAIVIVASVVVGGQAVAAMRRPAQRVVRTAVVAQSESASGLVVLPFAVPVAVPVTVLSQPAVLYSYRQYAEPNVAPPAAEPASSAPIAPSATAPAPTAAVVDPVVALLSARCAKCHTGATPPGHLQIFDAAGQIVAKLPRRAIVDMVSPDAGGRQRMPPDDLPKLNSDEWTAIGQWARPPKELLY
jgi:uncharacterized membrane protein